LITEDYKKWVMSEEFKKIYISLPPEIRKVIRHQIPRCGSCGEGNHFCELQKDNEGNIWFMLHFGSRNLGQQVGNYYNKKALKENERWYSSVESKQDLHFLPKDSPLGIEYWTAMNLCLTYAKFNHAIVANTIKTILEEEFKGKVVQEYYVSHNYASYESHFKENFIIHRKGATSAKEGEIGIIPGSLGTKSYIVKGKGNPDSFFSSSHGAGRTMSRTRAKAELNLEAEKKVLDDQGIVHGIRNQADLDEAVGSYKDITVVMKNQEDLVDIVTELTPVASLKG
jgi:tRNA-splicing ligase RtcB (3'-phosphate/5'-hydroxy nucleic acid ligase)